MPTAMQGFREFAETVWANRAHIAANMAGPNTPMAVMQAATNAIYNYYNQPRIRAMPNFRNVLNAYARVFRQNAAVDFEIQYLDEDWNGGEIAEDFEALLLLAALPPWSAVQVLTNVANIFHNPPQHDPTLIMGDFIYKTIGAGVPAPRFRVYVTPVVAKAPDVYCDLVNAMSAPNSTLPKEGKLSVPLPDDSADRSDRIVLYCAGQADLDAAIAWLRADPRANQAAWFDNESPLGTKPVDGLRGVSIANEPNMAPAVMARAGQNGVSFGSSRAAVLALGLRDNPRNFYEFWTATLNAAQEAGLDLRLTRTRIN